MPIIESGYKAPFYIFSKHLQTILPALFRKVGKVVFTRERLNTNDGDFLDLDWSRIGSSTLVIISHGLESNSKVSYNLGMTKALNESGYDVMAWNYRSCSGEMNRCLRFYHSGESGDLNFVIQHAGKNYQKIILIGFSIGGNITLKYIGEQSTAIDPKIKCAVTFSVPCHLESGAWHLAQWKNHIYMFGFIKSLKKKLKEKARLMPGQLQLEGLDKIRTFPEFDERYTAPIHGFKNAKDYWHKSSSLYYIKSISIPTLLVNSLNDPFLTPQCYPRKEAIENPQFYLEMPATGGHVGFFENNDKKQYWSEQRAIEFISIYI